MSVLITGWRSRIAEEFRGLVDVPCIRGDAYDIDPGYSHYLICNGMLRPKQEQDQTPEERAEGRFVNFNLVASACERILAANRAARICVIGSESAYRGSFDGVYAKAKKALHDYVETKKVSQGQQLVAISPGIIADAGMTTRREDVENLERRRLAHPQKRFVTSQEVAELAAFLLFRAPYVSGTVVRMHGGDV